MSSYQESVLRRAISKKQFEQLCCLWQKTAQAKQALYITETGLSQGKRCQEHFRLLIDQQFCALLLGNYIAKDIVYASTTFDPQAIAHFLPLLKEQLDRTSLRKRLQQIQQPQLAKQTNAVNRFALQLLEILTPPNCAPSPSAQRVLYHQERERIFNQVSFQISQNLDGSIILKKTVEQVRSLLQVDRLVIYQTDVDLGEHPTVKSNQAARGEADRGVVDAVTYEALASESVPSILHFHEEVCLSESPDCREKYRRGFTLAVDDVSADPDLGLCVKMLLQDLQVKAKLVTPINVQGKLWGFLIAHQCTTRQWHQQEIQFLEDIAEYLAIAIDQVRSYQKLQQQKQGLEQQVAQRVQELEETRIAAQAADQSKYEFLSNISHEFRTPLTHVIGLSSTLMHWSKQGVSFPVHKQQQYLETIHDSGKQLLALINNLLDLSQVKAGQSLLHVSEFSLQQLSRQVFHSVQPVAAAQGIILQLDLQIEPNQDRFGADPERVQQILCHLLDNAIKFTPTGNTVTLRACRDDEHAIFQVEDTGIGVAKEQLPLLFNTFQQLEHSRQRTHGGTGLGLTLTKELVDLHQGTVEVKSTVGKGSLFTVRLPPQRLAFAQPQRGVIPESNPDASRGGSEASSDREPVLAPSGDRTANSQQAPADTVRTKGIVVLIENNEKEAASIGEILRAADYQTIWLTDSSTAAAQIQWLQPSYIILARRFPNLRHTLQTLKATSNAKLFLVASDEAQQEITEQVDDVIQTPIQAAQLIEKLGSEQ